MDKKYVSVLPSHLGLGHSSHFMEFHHLVDAYNLKNIGREITLCKIVFIFSSVMENESNIQHGERNPVIVHRLIHLD